MKSNIHPAILPIIVLLVAIVFVGIGVMSYRSYGQKKESTVTYRKYHDTPTAEDLNPKYEAPKWKTRQVWKDGKYIQETYRDPTEYDRMKEMKHQEELMKIKGRL